jgi:hypothetical protein
MAPSLTRIAALIACATACASGGGLENQAGAPAPAASDSTRLLVPAGYGSLRQEDISITLQVLRLQVRALPLDENVIRVLSPDSYRAMRELVASLRADVAAASRRTGQRSFSLWYVQFFGLEQGETRFSPQEFIVSSVGRDFRPLEVLPVTPGFGEQRLQQREMQRGVYLFDPQVDINQPLVVQYETARNSDWSTILSRIERERALVRSRAGAKQLDKQR